MDAFSLQDSTVAIIGLGLMGGSLALALRGKCRRIIGSDCDPAAVEAACKCGIVDRAQTDPAVIVAAADVVILAIPVPAILQTLDVLPSWANEPCIVIDLGSSKRAIVDAMDRLPGRFDPLGGHPLCGKEKLSIQNADAQLYHGAPFLLAPLPRTSQRASSAAYQIIEAVGARAMQVDASEHDRMLASTSHMPYLLSSALALATPSECAPLVGPGFRSTSRLAGTPSSMMLGVLRSNRDHVLGALHSLQDELTRLESALASPDPVQLESLLDDSQAQYRRLVQ